MVWLMERSKLVVEGGGAAGAAAVLAGKVGVGGTQSRGATVIVLSGGNVDAGLLAAVAQRNETLMGRRIRLFTRISDRPGGLAALLTLIAEAGGNVVHAGASKTPEPVSRGPGPAGSAETRPLAQSPTIRSGATAVDLDCRERSDGGRAPTTHAHDRRRDLPERRLGAGRRHLDCRDVGSTPSRRPGGDGGQRGGDDGDHRRDPARPDRP
jgi:hypothetical protein